MLTGDVGAGGERAAEPANKQASHRGASEKDPGMSSCVVAYLLHDGTGLTLLQPARGLVHRLGSSANHLAGHAVLFAAVRHRLELCTECPEPSGGPLLLLFRLLPHLGGSFPGKVACLPPSLGDNLFALVRRLLGDLLPGVCGLSTNLGRLGLGLVGLPGRRTGRGS
ncbi:hypothetical protein AB0M79_34750 [Polymorphospora sp. NPDC051019]|uniref:hypothetical protein n=1 Tax=Polymorphospora sp. NPDC051019 TaxID=3155725 RepID=UPI00342AC6AD